MPKIKELRRLGIRPKVLERRLGPILSKSMNKDISVQRVRDIKVLDATSMNFNVARMTVEYKDKQDDINKQLKLILKRLKPDYQFTDFSHMHTRIHREREDLPEYTKRLFEFIQGPINNGKEENYLVRFYGQYKKELYEEDAGDISLETLFREKTPDTNLLRNLVEIISLGHSRWAIKIPTKINELYGIRKETAFREKLHDYLDVILRYYEETLTKNEENAIGKLFESIDSYLDEESNPAIRLFIRLIHSELHLGHVFLKYGDKSLKTILKMSREDLKKQDPRIKIVDVTGFSIGPQTFDLVDAIKHPVAINAQEYPTLVSQRNLVESLVELYRKKRLEAFEDSFGAEFKNGDRELKKSLEFLTFFEESNIYRNIRATAKGILLKTKKENEELYQSYLKSNPKYDLYHLWYLADLGQTLHYLTTNKFEDALQPIDQQIIKEAYEVLANHIDEVRDNPIEISRKIVKYEN